MIEWPIGLDRRLGIFHGNLLKLHQSSNSHLFKGTFDHYELYLDAQVFEALKIELPALYLTNS